MSSVNLEQNQPLRYHYTIVSSLPLGITIADDYGNLILEAYGAGSDMKPGQMRTSHSKEHGPYSHTVSLALTQITNLAGQPITIRPKLKVVK